jgi:hypothetical protein
MFVVAVPQDYECDSDAFLREEGYEPGPRDFIVEVIQFTRGAGVELRNVAVCK